MTCALKPVCVTGRYDTILCLESSLQIMWPPLGMHCELCLCDTSSEWRQCVPLRQSAMTLVVFKPSWAFLNMVWAMHCELWYNFWVSLYMCEWSLMWRAAVFGSTVLSWNGSINLKTFKDNSCHGSHYCSPECWNLHHDDGNITTTRMTRNKFTI